MSGPVVQLCECPVGLLVKAENNIFSISRSFVRPDTRPDLTRKHSGGTKQNKRKNEKKNEQVKAKN